MKQHLHQFIDQMIEHNFTIEETIDLVEKVYIERVLELHNHNVSASARHMGMHRNTLSRKIANLGIRE